MGWSQSPYGLMFGIFFSFKSDCTVSVGRRCDITGGLLVTAPLSQR